MKKLLLALLLTVGAVNATAQTDTVRHEILLETTMGNIRLALYNETPLHRDNFLKLVRDGYYDGNLFHRVISRFMIQSGDSTSRHAKAGEQLGEGDLDYRIPSEIVFPKYFHKRGALAAAREGDDINPNRESSAAQFYIVYGRRFNDEMLAKVQERITKATDGKITLTPEIRQAYFERGGTPHLDGQYTVFGEVLEGIDVVERIQMVETDKNDRPVEDVRIVKATVIK